MHDQRNAELADGEAGIDRTVLGLLLEDDSQRLWRSMRSRANSGTRRRRDALARLCGAGLIHRLDGFVFAARPAVRAAQLGEKAR